MSEKLDKNGERGRVALDMTSGDLRVVDAEKEPAKVTGAFTESEDNVKKWNWRKWHGSRMGLG